VESLIKHKPFFAGGVSEHLLNYYVASTRKGEGALTPRERLILQMLSEGHGNKEVAAILNLSAKTVESHRVSLMRKLNLTSTADVVRYAIRNKIIEP